VAYRTIASKKKKKKKSVSAHSYYSEKQLKNEPDGTCVERTCKLNWQAWDGEMRRSPVNLDPEMIRSNYYTKFGLNLKSVSALYPSEINIMNISRACVFEKRTQGANAKERRKGAETKTMARHTRLLLDLFLEYGIIGMKRGGSMLGLYREGGTLQDDREDADHFFFLPKRDVIPPEYVYILIRDIAKRNGCTLKSYDKQWGDAFRCDIQCGVGTNDGQITSHGIAYYSEYLLYDCEKTMLLANYGINIHSALRSLCVAPYDDAYALSFDSPHIERQLSAVYGEDFMTPKSKYKGLRNKTFTQLVLGVLQDPKHPTKKATQRKKEW
jgi:hypothetical protein